MNLQHSAFKSNLSDISDVHAFQFPSEMDSDERGARMKESLMSLRQSMLASVDGPGKGSALPFPGMSLDGEFFKPESLGSIDYNKVSAFPSLNEISDYKKLSELHALVNATDAEGNKVPLPDDLSD